MPNAPGIYLSETDLSQIVSNANDLVLAVVGGATQGPMNTPTLCPDEYTLTSIFGPPVASDYGLLTALRFLRQGSSVTYLRVGDAGSLATADRDIPGTSGGFPATFATGLINFQAGSNAADADYITLHNLTPTATLENHTAGTIGNVAITLGGSGVSGRIAFQGMSGGTSGTRAVGEVYFIASVLPVSGDQVIISDGTDVVTFEFGTGSSTSTHRYITIAADSYGCMTNLIAGINTAPAFGVSATNAATSVTFEFDNNGSHTPGNIPVAIGANSNATKNNLIAALGVNTTSFGVVDTSSSTNHPQITLTNNLSGTLGNATTLVSSSTVTVTGLSGATDPTSGSSVSVLYVAAISPGSWGNHVQVVITATTAIGAEAGAFDLTVNTIVGDSTVYTAVEQFTNLNLDSASARYIQTVINHGIANENNKSQYIVCTSLANDGAPTPASYLLGSGGGVVGGDGISGLTAADVVGNNSGSAPTGMQALYDTDNVIFNVLSVPGWSDIAVVNAGILLGETRQDLVYLPDVPIGLTPIQWMNWSDGINVPGVTDQPVVPLNSSYAALFAGWVKTYSTDLEVNVWMPPSAIYASALAYVYRSSGYLWNAVAGVINGLVSDALDVEASPNPATREIIQNTVGGQRVNPFLKRAGIGVTIEGNRTLYRTNSKLARLHVRMMLNFLKAAIRTAALKIQWLPINDVTYAQAQNVIIPILEFLRTNGALDTSTGDMGYQFVCDDSNNTPATKANDALQMSVSIRPVGVAEQIDVNISIFNNGAQFVIA